MKYENKLALVMHRSSITIEGMRPPGVEAMYNSLVSEQPAPGLLVRLDAAGFTLKCKYKSGGGWYWEDALGNASGLYPDLPSALRGWEGTPRSHTTCITNSLTHHLDAAHRLAAQVNLPHNVTIPPDAGVTPVEKDGRVTGVWVEAKVFVELRPQQ